MELGFVEGEGITGVLGSRAVGGCSQFSFHDAFLEASLMIADDALDLGVVFLLFLDVLIVQLVDVLPTGRIGLIGETHLHFLSLFVENQGVDVGIGIALFLGLFATTGAVLLG